MGNTARKRFIIWRQWRGKTHLACGIGYPLIEKSVRVKFTTATRIVQDFQRAKANLCLAEVLTRMDKYDVIIVDDIGYVKKTSQETQVLFEPRNLSWITSVCAIPGQRQAKAKMANN